MYLLFFRQKAHNVQESSQAGFRALTGGEGATVKTFPGGEIPLASDAEESTASERCETVFSGPTLGIHVFS